jgi:hypothetical protein
MDVARLLEIAERARHGGRIDVAARLLGIARRARVKPRGGVILGQTFKKVRKVALQQRRRNWRGVRDNLQQSATEAQVIHHNREMASVHDYAMRPQASQNASDSVKGSGKWRQRTSEETLRLAYSGPALTLRAIAATARPVANHVHIANLIYACASIQQEKQGIAIDQGQAADNFSVFPFVFDETKFEMMLPVEDEDEGDDQGHRTKRKNTRMSVDLSILGFHGRLVWGDSSGITDEDEIVLKPVGIETNTAAHMWSALRHALPKSLWLLLHGVTPCKASAIVPSQDSHSANKMLLQHVENLCDSSEKVFVLPAWCRQHSTGNCLQPLLESTGVVPPLYCLIRRLKNYRFKKRLHLGIRLSIKSILRHIKGSEYPSWRPKENDLQQSRDLLELLYYRKDLRDSEDWVYVSLSWGGEGICFIFSVGVDAAWRRDGCRTLRTTPKC